MGEFLDAERFECLKPSLPFMEMDTNSELMRQLAELSGSAMHSPSMGLMDYSDEYYLPRQSEFSIPFIDDLTGPPAERQKPIAGSQPAGSVGEQSHGDRKRKMIAESNASSHNFSEVSSVIGSAEVNTKKKNGSESGRRRKSNSKEAGKPKEVVHVRARRGQATDSHSLAERVRRRKINERMRCLQDLVPGCYKTMGMAGMLDEIINYVQSLQNQVEFLSMKLSAASSVYDYSLGVEAIAITQKYLTKKASAAVLHLLPESAGGDLAAVCSWADEVRFRYRWSSPLHYANTPGVCNFEYSRDCHNSKGVQDMCVVGAINNYTTQLLSNGDASSGYNLQESLMFLAHFVGDVHQPLHVGFAEDEGGNTIIVHWYRRKSNLHHVWDVNIIETAMRDFYNNDLGSMIEAIEMNITNEWSDEVSGWKRCSATSMTCADKYASESIRLACDYAYKDVEQDSTLGDDYFFSRLPVVEKRIAQAGVRLASLLNRVFRKTEEEEVLQLVVQSVDEARAI
ncbi:unnamed protein product [Musa textilis]